MLKSDTVAQTVEALHDPAAVAFAQMCLAASYARHCVGHVDAVREMVAEVFHCLIAASHRPETLLDEARRLSLTLFQRDDSTHWFTAAYHRYKTGVRQEQDFHNLQRMLTGRRILDFGCGSGLTAVRLKQGGYDVVTADVLDYRAPTAFHLPFVPVRSLSALPFADGAFDAAVALCVLHHIDSDQIPVILAELARVARQVLLVEDVYGVEHAALDVADCTVATPFNGNAADDMLRHFMALNRRQQYLALVLLDFIPNIVVLGIADMNMPYQFKTVDEWERLLHASGLHVAAVHFCGFETYRMHPSCRAWLSCVSRQRLPAGELRR